MRYPNFAAVVLATTISQAIAGPRHAPHMHPRHNAEMLEAAVDKRAPQDWNTIQYTYSAGQTWGATTTTAAQEPASSSTTSATTATANPASVVASQPATSSATPSSSSTPSSGTTSSQLSTSDAGRLSAMGFQAMGTNAQDSSGGVWLGTGGPYTNEYTNNHGEGVILVVWGPDASWVNAHTPLITVSLPTNAKTTVSFADGSVGAWSAVYPDTPLINGQVSNTWAEYTYTTAGVVDVSREVNMTGYSMEVVGPDCTSNMDKCVFVCDSGNVCTTNYTLSNCASGSQVGAKIGLYEGSDSGGCGWNGAASASFATSFGDLS